MFHLTRQLMASRSGTHNMLVRERLALPIDESTSMSFVCSCKDLEPSLAVRQKYMNRFSETRLMEIPLYTLLDRDGGLSNKLPER